MPSAPSRFEVEHLHRLMMEASAAAAALDQRLARELRADELSGELRHWVDAAEAVQQAVQRSREALLRAGTPEEQLDRLRDRLSQLEARAREFDLDEDFEECVQHWERVALELSQLSGPLRDGLVRLLEARRARIDQATATLSQARGRGGVLAASWRAVLQLTAERDRAREKYERIRRTYLEAEEAHRAAEQQRQGAIPQEPKAAAALLPDRSRLARKGPIVVRLPEAPAGTGATPSPPAAKGATSPAPLPLPSLPVARRPTAEPRSGAPRIELEGMQKAGSYAPGPDGIGRGAQTATLSFRADRLGGDLQVQASTLQLGCGVRLDVLPSVELLSPPHLAPVRGRLLLGLRSSGGRLGAVPVRAAQESARLVAQRSAGAVAARLGVFGRQLQPALAEVLQDAVGRIFSRATLAAARPLPIPLRGNARLSAHFDGDLGSLIVEAREVRGGQTHKHRLGALLDRDPRHRSGAAAQVHETLRHLATAGHRTLTDPFAGELRANLARMDSVLARLRGNTGREPAEGAEEIGRILQRMGAIAASSGGAPHLAQFQRLVDERSGQLRKVLRRDGPPAPSAAARQLQELRSQDPALDRLLRDASQSQLSALLAKVGAGSLQRLGQGQPASPALAGLAHSLGGAALGGLGAGQRGGTLAGGVGLAQAMSALAPHLGAEGRGGRQAEARQPLSGLLRAPAGSALHGLAHKAEEKRRRIAADAQRPRSANALLEAFQQHPRGRGMTRHLQPGGALHTLCEAAQRSHGLPIGKAAQHYLASRGSSHLWGAVQTFHSLVRDGHKPHFWSLSSIAHAVKDNVSSTLHDVSSSVGRARGLASAALQTVRQGVSGVAGGAAGLAQQAQGFGTRSLTGAGNGLLRGARALENGKERWARAAWGGLRRTQGSLDHVAHSGLQALQAGAHWAQHKVGQAEHWSRDRVHAGLEWMKKTGVAGALGTGLRTGLSSLKAGLQQTPIGLAIRAAHKGSDWMKGGGLAKAWQGAQHLAGRAFDGLKTATRATTNFLQSPGGQLLVTGLSLAASFIPGGIVVKAIIGGGIGAIQAISEGKDWKGVLASAAGGALTGALPFLKLGPFAKLGIGALQGGLATLAGGGSFKDALKAASAGALDSVEPGAFHSLKRLKGFSTAEKLLKGKKLSKAEKALLERGKLSGPLRALEKVMESPRMRKSMGALERVGGKAVKGGVWVSGKAARAQRVLDKVVGAGDQVHGVLSQVHDLAPGLAEALGDNAAGHFVGGLGEWAGKGDHALAGVLERGHGASDALHEYRGYLDKGLGYAGVKDPQKAYRKMMAHHRRAHRALEQVDAHRRQRRGEHPELDLAHAAGKRTRGAHHEAASQRRRVGRTAGSRLEHALARGRKLIRRGEKVAQGVDDGLGKVHATVAHGLAGAERLQRDLEQASQLARSGADILGEESELGKYLLELSGHADHIHGYLQQGIDLASSFDHGVEGARGALEEIPGVHARSPLGRATHLQGRRRGKKEHAAEHEAGSAHRIDADLGKLERSLGKGVRIGRKVDAGMDKAAALSDALAKMLGDDTPVGHLAEQVGEAAHGEHDKLHEALALAAKGKSFVHKGRQLFQQGMTEAEAHHEKKLAKVHGKKPSGRVQHDLHTLGADGRRLVHGIYKTEKDARHAWHDGQHLYKDGRKQVHGTGQIWGDAQHFGRSGQRALGEARTLWDDLRAGHPGDALTHGKGLFADMKGLLAEGKGLLGEGAGLFGLGKKVWGEGEGLAHDVQGLREDVQGLGRDGRRTAADGRRLGADAAELPGGAASDPASTLRAAHQALSDFGDEVTSATREIDQLIAAGATQAASDRVRAVSAVSERARAAVRAAVGAAGQGALARHAAAADDQYLELRHHFLAFVEGLHGLAGEEGRIARKQGRAAGGFAQRPSRGRRHQGGQDHPACDLLEEGRLHLHRGAIRGAMAVQDAQDVDSAAMDTWTGSGEGAKLFSEVFGAFLPAEAAAVAAHGRKRGGRARRRQHPGGAPGTGAGRPGTDRSSGFFKDLFDHLHDFADHVAGWAQSGEGLLGKGMHFAERGMHGLHWLEGAAGNVQDIAGKAEGFLDRIGSHNLASFAGSIGGAAGWVDGEAEILHGGLKKADRWMGQGKSVAGSVEGGAKRASGIFGEAAEGHFGSLLHLFKASRGGDGIDGRTAPDQVRLGSALDEPRRLDVTTLSRMEGFLGGSFSGVRIHTGPGAAEVTGRFNAEAVTVQEHIFFAPGRFNPGSVEGQKLLAHELTHVLQKGRPNLDVRTAETEALRAEHGFGASPDMTTLNLRQPQPDWKLPDGMGTSTPGGVRTAKRNRSRGDEAGARDTLPDGEEFLEQVSGRVYALLMEELEQSFESR